MESKTNKLIKNIAINQHWTLINFSRAQSRSSFPVFFFFLSSSRFLFKLSNFGIFPFSSFLFLLFADIYNLESDWKSIVTNAGNLEDRHSQQQEAIWELLRSEIDYIKMLRVVSHVSMFFFLQDDCFLRIAWLEEIRFVKVKKKIEEKRREGSLCAKFHLLTRNKIIYTRCF